MLLNDFLMFRLNDFRVIRGKNGGTWSEFRAHFYDVPALNSHVILLSGLLTAVELSSCVYVAQGFLRIFI